MKQIDKNHKEKRTVIRILGILFLVVGVCCMAVALVDFFGAFNNDPFTDHSQPTKFYLFFIGIPLLGIGSSLTGAGFMGAAARYHAEEIAPVGKDTINYMVDGTKDSIKEVSKAIHTGMKESQESSSSKTQSAGQKQDVIFCIKCGKENVSDATFVTGAEVKLYVN